MRKHQENQAWQGQTATCTDWRGNLSLGMNQLASVISVELFDGSCLLLGIYAVKRRNMGFHMKCILLNSSYQLWKTIVSCGFASSDLLGGNSSLETIFNSQPCLILLDSATLFLPLTFWSCPLLDDVDGDKDTDGSIPASPRALRQICPPVSKELP